MTIDKLQQPSGESLSRYHLQELTVFECMHRQFAGVNPATEWGGRIVPSGYDIDGDDLYAASKRWPWGGTATTEEYR